MIAFFKIMMVSWIILAILAVIVGHWSTVAMSVAWAVMWMSAIGQEMTIRTLTERLQKYEDV